MFVAVGAGVGVGQVAEPVTGAGMPPPLTVSSRTPKMPDVLIEVVAPAASWKVLVASGVPSRVSVQLPALGIAPPLLVMTNDPFPSSVHDAVTVTSGGIGVGVGVGVGQVAEPVTGEGMPPPLTVSSRTPKMPDVLIEVVAPAASWKLLLAIGVPSRVIVQVPALGMAPPLFVIVNDPTAPSVHDAVTVTSGPPGTGVWVAVGVAVGVSVAVAVGVEFGVSVAVAVGVELGVSVAVAVGVEVGVSVAVAVGVEVGVSVAVAVGVGEGVSVGVGVGVSAAAKTPLGTRQRQYGWPANGTVPEARSVAPGWARCGAIATDDGPGSASGTARGAAETVTAPRGPAGTPAAATAWTGSDAPEMTSAMAQHPPTSMVGIRIVYPPE